MACPRVFTAETASIETAENASDSYAWKETKRSGFGASFGGGRVGVSYGTTKKGNESETAETWNSGSMLGSENGDVSLHADKDVAITGSQVIAGTGDVAISGENVVIDNAYDTTDSKSREWHEQKSVGLSVGLGGAVGNAVNSGMSAINNAERSQNAMTDRAGALYGIAGARDAYEAGKAVVDMATKPGGVMNGGNLGLSVELGFSSSKSESRQESHDTSVVGSYVQSGGDTAITARDDLTVIGSEIHAGGEVTLDAANDLALLSVEESSDFSSSNKSSSFGVGASIGVGVGINVGLNGNMSRSKGSGNGSGGTHVETIIQGDKGVDFASGDDTTLKGAQIIGDRVVGNVGGDLAITSEQDTYNESRRQSSSGGGISIGTGLGGGLANVGGSYSSQNQKGKSDYASVDEQSGIYAGEGGFDITVGVNTHLEGAVIASEAAPEGNLLTTGSLTTNDIANNSSHEATTKGFGGEFTYARNPGNGDKNANTGSVSPSLPMKERGDDHSTTKSAIADGSIVITDEESQLAKTGQTAEEAVADLNRDTDNAHSGALERPASLEELFAKQAELTEAAGLAGKAIAKTVGDISQQLFLKTRDKNWREGGIYRAALHAGGAVLVAQIGNGEGLNAAVGVLAEQLAQGKIREVAYEIAKNLTDDPDARSLLTNLIGNGIISSLGYAVGSETGSSTASIVDRDNRQIHDDEWARLISLAMDDNGYIDKQKLIALVSAAASLVELYAEYPEGSEEYVNAKKLADDGDELYGAEKDLLRSLQSEGSFYIEPGTGLSIYHNLFELTDGEKSNDALIRSLSTPRVRGFFQAVGAVGSAVGTGVWFAGSKTTIPTAVMSLIGLALSADEFVTGLSQTISGRPVDTAIHTLSIAAGLSDSEARLVDSIAKLGVPGIAVGTVKSALNTARINKWAKVATKNAHSDIVVLGKYEEGLLSSYERVALGKKATYFHLKEWDYVKEIIGEKKMWDINEKFLDMQIDLGKTFHFSHNPMNATGSFAREVEHISRRGYQLVEEAGGWVAKKK